MSHQAKRIALKYMPLKAMKRQALADFLAQHPWLEIQNPLANCQDYVQIKPWTLAFDGSKHQMRVGEGIVITSSEGVEEKFIYRLDIQCSNNQAKYEAFIIG